MSPHVVDIIFQLVALVFAICFHESAHAWTANKCGDPTARMLGRISLNPIKHVDIFGTIIFPVLLVASGFGAFGWAKPTPVDPRNLRHPVRDDILTALAGPVSNVLLGLFAVLVLGILMHSPGGQSVLEPLFLLFRALLEVNILLAAFNLIPIPPLDGSHVIVHLMSPGAQDIYEKIGFVALILLFVILPWLGSNIGFQILAIFSAPFQILFGSLMKIVAII